MPGTAPFSLYCQNVQRCHGDGTTGSVPSNAASQSGSRRNWSVDSVHSSHQAAAV